MPIGIGKIKEDNYRNVLITVIMTLDNAAKNPSKLANGIFNGLDMFNDVMNDGGRDLSDSKEDGIELVKSIMPKIKDEDLDIIRRLVSEILTNANERFMGSRVIQHKQSGESRCFFIDWDSERYKDDAKKCRYYFDRLFCSIFNPEIFPENLLDIDKDLVYLVIEQPDSFYALIDLKKGFESQKDAMLDSTRKEILFAQRFFSNKLALDYLSGNLPFLLENANLNQNTRVKLEFMRDFWQYNSLWCNKYECYEGTSGNLAYNPDSRIYDFLVSRDEQDKLKYSTLKNVLNRIMIQIAGLSEESIKKLVNTDFLREVEQAGNKTQRIKKLLSKRITESNKE